MRFVVRHSRQSDTALAVFRPARGWAMRRDLVAMVPKSAIRPQRNNSRDTGRRSDSATVPTTLHNPHADRSATPPGCFSPAARTRCALPCHRPTRNLLGHNFLRHGCGPLNSDNVATSSHCSLAAITRGRRKRKAAPPMDAKTPASTPNGSSCRNERRDLILSVLICVTRRTSFDAPRATILPTVAIGHRRRQNNFCITESFQVRQVNLFSEPEVTPMSSDQEPVNSRGSLRLAPASSELEIEKAKLPRQFVNFTFYKARTEWRLLSDCGQAALPGRVH